MPKTISFIAFALVCICLSNTVSSQPNINSKPRLSFGLDMGIPSWFPDDALDYFSTGRALRVSALYGGRLSAGLSFDYSTIDQQESVTTADTGPEPLGTLTSQVKNQFFALALKYKPLAGPGMAKIAPYAGLRMGLLKRNYDVGLEQYDTFSDENRFAYAIDLGIEFAVHSRIGLAVSSTYFRTSKPNPESDFAGSFDIAGTYGSINIGAIYRL